jgi:hypothetical protein
VWAKESYEIATKIAYQNGRLREPPKGHRKECREVTDAAVFPTRLYGDRKAHREPEDHARVLSTGGVAKMGCEKLMGD